MRIGYGLRWESDATMATAVRDYKFRQVDVFGARAQAGNPVAVVQEAEGLNDEAMAAFARWTNLSETTFLLPPTRPEADYRLRIFTPGGELPFAGHPTLGSAHAWLEAGGQPQQGARLVQECGVGLVTLRRSEAGLAFCAPPLLREGPLEPELVAELTAALGLEPRQVVAHQWVDNGPGWCALLLASAEEVLAVKPDMQALGDHRLGLIGPWRGKDRGADFEVRAFVPGLGVPEDPVTGSLNAGLAQWMIQSGRAPQQYRASQGRALGRDGLIQVAQEDQQVWIGGRCVSVIEGRVAFP